AGSTRRDVAAVANHDWIHEMLVQVIDILDDAILQRRAHGDVVEEGQVLHVLAQPDSSSVRTDGRSELRGEEHYRKALVHAAEPAGIDLAEADGAGLHELLEHDAILTLLARRDANRRDGASDGCVAEDVVGTRGLLDPPRVERRQLADPVDRLADVPDLVGIHHELALRPDLGPNECSASQVVTPVAADLDLEVRPALL